MTTKQRLIHWLTSNGMFENDAEAIFQRALPKLQPDAYLITWDQPAEEYPDALYEHWIVILKEVGLDYIDEVCPKAWYRPMFTPDPEAELKRLGAIPGQ